MKPENNTEIVMGVAIVAAVLRRYYESSDEAVRAALELISIVREVMVQEL